jgi:radical SAM protein with 4Fe4S-binding SPASM domain
MNSYHVAASSLPGFALWDKLRQKQLPTSFSLELTARCNHDCRHCYINLPAPDRQAQARELSLAEISTLADEAIGLGVVSCLLTGGEPLLRRDFVDIYLALKRKGLLVSLHTNATLLQRDHVKLFKEYPPRDIEITVYGVTQETFGSVTRRPTLFAPFMRALELLRDNGVAFRLKAMALRSNSHELLQIADFCRAHTKDYYRFDPWLHLRLDGDPARNQEIKSERLAPEEIARLEKADPQRFAALSRHCDDFIMPGKQADPSGPLFFCGLGQESFDVSYDGQYRLCPSLRAPGTTYDLRQGSLREAWQTVGPQVRQLTSCREKYVQHCKNCSIINLCLWCPAMAHLEAQALDAWVEYFCQVAHARARSLAEAVTLTSKP